MSFANLLLRTRPFLASSATISAVSAVTLASRPTLCLDAALSTSKTSSRTAPLIDPHQFATGSLIGITSSLLFKRLGKIFFLIIGASWVLLRALSSASGDMIPAIQVPWARMRRFVLNRTSSSSDPNAPAPLVSLLTKDLTFKVRENHASY